MNKIWIIILMTALTIMACKDPVIELPASSTGLPVFTNYSTLDGASFDLIAGDDDYYMYSEWTKDANDVHTFIGRFAEENCESNCKESLQFEIRNITPVATGTPSVNSLLTKRTLTFKDANALADDLVQVQFHLNTDVENPDKIVWSFGEEPNSSYAFDITDPIHNFAKSGLYYPICGVEEESTRCNFTSTLDFSINSNCITDYSINELADGSIELKAVTTANSDPFFYTWNYGLGNGSDQPSFTIKADELNPETDCFLEIFYEDGCLSNIVRNFVEDSSGNLSYCSATYDYDILQEIENGTLLQLGKFALEYTDPDGKVYRSDLQEQPFDHSFEIISAEDYTNNENGEKTKKLNVRYSCRVYADDGSFLSFIDGTAIIAVAYPN